MSYTDGIVFPKLWDGTPTRGHKTNLRGHKMIKNRKAENTCATSVVYFVRLFSYFWVFS